MIQKWPIWKPVRGPRWSRFRVHKSVSFWAIFGGPLTVALWTPNRHSRGSVLQKEAFKKRAPNWLFTRGQMWSPNRLSSISFLREKTFEKERSPLSLYTYICCEVRFWPNFWHFDGRFWPNVLCCSLKEITGGRRLFLGKAQKVSKLMVRIGET